MLRSLLGFLFLRYFCQRRIIIHYAKNSIFEGKRRWTRIGKVEKQFNFFSGSGNWAVRILIKLFFQFFICVFISRDDCIFFVTPGPCSTSLIETILMPREQLIYSYRNDPKMHSWVIILFDFVWRSLTAFRIISLKVGRIARESASICLWIWILWRLNSVSSINTKTINAYSISITFEKICT